MNLQQRKQKLRDLRRQLRVVNSVIDQLSQLQDYMSGRPSVPKPEAGRSRANVGSAGGMRATILRFPDPPAPHPTRKDASAS